MSKSLPKCTFLFKCFSLLAIFSQAVAAADTVDNADDSTGLLGYVASSSLAGIAFVLLLLVAFSHTWLMKKYGGLFMLAMLIGEYIFAGGIATRLALHSKPDSTMIYIIQSTLIVLSPCAFIASEYALLGRLARRLKCEDLLLIRSTRITLVFVLSDVSTFLIQAAGGGIMSAASKGDSDSADSTKLGSNLFLAGLILQLISFCIFVLVFLRFVQLVRLRKPQVWAQDKIQGNPWYSDWRALAAALCISCICIVIRCIYRVTESSQGFGGSISKIEGLFYGLDTLPLFIAIAVYVPFWPGRFIPKFTTAVCEEKGLELESSDQVSQLLGTGGKVY